MDKVTIELNSKWLRIVRSPLIWVIWTFQGVSITMAPLFLYWSGSGKLFPSLNWLVVPLCFALIFLIPAFYIWLGAEVIKELRKHGDRVRVDAV
jgi:ABC-type transport system involved in multi-copper enzyme maturation permease subunit